MPLKTAMNITPNKPDFLCELSTAREVTQQKSTYLDTSSRRWRSRDWDEARLAATHRFLRYLDGSIHQPLFITSIALTRQLSL